MSIVIKLFLKDAQNGILEPDCTTYIGAALKIGHSSGVTPIQIVTCRLVKFWHVLYKICMERVNLTNVLKQRTNEK